MSPHRRLPISARHAFALAFDLAVRRDSVQSIAIPLLLRAPWILAPAIVRAAWPGIRPEHDLLVKAGAELLDFLAIVVVSAMLRFRARSVFNTPAETHPAPAGECYARGLRRVPALYVTEVLRNAAFGLSLGMLFVPFLYLGFKLSLATEAVVLRQMGPVRAATRSFQLTEGRFERWLEMIAMSVFLVVPLWFLMAVCYLTVPGGFDLWFAIGKVLTAAVLPLVQYAWTFFYLRLEEIDPAAELQPHAAEPAAAGRPAWEAGRGAQPQLRLVELPPEAEDDRPR